MAGEDPPEDPVRAGPVVAVRIESEAPQVGLPALGIDLDQRRDDHRQNARLPGIRRQTGHGLLGLRRPLPDGLGGPLLGVEIEFLPLLAGLQRLRPAQKAAERGAEGGILEQHEELGVVVEPAGHAPRPLPRHHQGAVHRHRLGAGHRVLEVVADEDGHQDDVRSERLPPALEPGGLVRDAEARSPRVEHLGADAPRAQDLLEPGRIGLPFPGSHAEGEGVAENQDAEGARAFEADLRPPHPFPVDRHRGVEFDFVGDRPLESGLEAVSARRVRHVEPARDGHHGLRAHQPHGHFSDQEADPGADPQQEKAGEGSTEADTHGRGWYQVANRLLS